MSEHVLEKLVSSFDDFKERLIRIEENVKMVKEIKDDVDEIDKRSTATEESAKSAHKRIDAMEQKEKERNDDIKFLKRAVITGFIGFMFTLLGGVILAAVKGWI